MDLRLIPMRLEFRAFAKVKLCIWKKCWSKTLFDKILWAIEMKMINITIFNYNDAEMDVSPPEIGWYDKAVSSICHVDDECTICHLDDE